MVQLLQLYVVCYLMTLVEKCFYLYRKDLLYFTSQKVETLGHVRHRTCNGVEPFLNVYLHSCCL